jgi:hypothetical protein
VPTATGKWEIKQDGQIKRIVVVEEDKTVKVSVSDDVELIPASYDSASWENNTPVKVKYFRRGGVRWAQVIEKM